jgi:hypothetical protein
MTTKLRWDVRPSFDLCQAPRGANDGSERVLIGSRLTGASLRQVAPTGASLEDADFAAGIDTPDHLAAMLAAAEK